MASRFIVFLFALIALAHAESVRHRRQVVNNSSTIEPATLPFSSMEVPCPVRCILSMSQAWTKAVSFDIPSPSMLEGMLMLGDNDTYSVMCSLYSNYARCLDGCGASNNERNKAARDAAPPLSEVCTDKRSDFDATFPCLANNTRTFQRVCQRQNEEALAAAVRLTTSPRLEEKALNDFCKEANDQLFCLFPLIRQTCGDTPYDLIRSIANASFVSVRVAIGDEAITTLFPDCELYLTTIGQGIPSVSDNATANMDSNATSTMMVTTPVTTIDSGLSTPATGLGTTTTMNVLRRDDADGTGEQDGQRFDGTGAPRLQTTQSSRAACRTCFNFLAYFTVTLVFYFFV